MAAPSSVASGRSWTDSTTNNIFYSGVDANDYLRWLGDRKYGDKQHLVSEFLHEYTHHWCFATPVGAAIALIDLRLCVFASVFRDGRAQWAREWIGAQSLTSMLRPLSEGLALFAEFDATLSDKEIRQATPIGAASLCFVTTAGDIGTRVDLQFLRHSDVSLDRKASLYLRPFETEEGYLSGYMLVKTMFLAMSERAPSMGSELFMSYVKTYFWEDAGFINLLLSDEANGYHVAGALLERFKARVMSLLTDVDIADKLQNFWSRWSASGEKSFAAEIGLSVEEVNLCYERLNDLAGHSISLLRKGADEITRCTHIAVADLEELFTDVAVYRGYIVVAQTRVTVSADGSCHLADSERSAETAIVYAGEANGHHPAPGTYDYLAIMPTHAAFLLTVFCAESIHIGGVVGPPSVKIDWAQVSKFLRAQSTILNRQRVLKARFEEVGIGSFQSRSSDFCEHMETVILSVYLTLASIRAKDAERLQIMRQVLAERGLKGLFRGDPLAVRVLAAVSLVTSAGEASLHNYEFYNLLRIAQMYFFRDIDIEVLAETLAKLIAADTDSFVIKEVAGTVFPLL